MWSQDQLAYMAGIIDGEGSISIDVQSPNKTRKYHYYSIRMNIINTNLELMEWLVKNFGGNLYKNRKVEKRKQVYKWSIYSRKAAEILQQTLPYMIVKKPHAIILIEFMDSMGVTGWHVPEEIRHYRQQLYLKVRELNKHNG